MISALDLDRIRMLRRHSGCQVRNHGSWCSIWTKVAVLKWIKSAAELAIAVEITREERRAMPEYVNEMEHVMRPAVARRQRSASRALKFSQGCSRRDDK
jgi:hypothetical protein